LKTSLHEKKNRDQNKKMLRHANLVKII